MKLTDLFDEKWILYRAHSTTILLHGNLFRCKFVYWLAAVGLREKQQNILYRYCTQLTSSSTVYFALLQLCLMDTHQSWTDSEDQRMFQWRKNIHKRYRQSRQHIWSFLHTHKHITWSRLCVCDTSRCVSITNRNDTQCRGLIKLAKVPLRIQDVLASKPACKCDRQNERSKN